ncbi:MAG: FlgD immunoglobulin-like domain containing protein, partial [bacterium]
AAPEQIYLKYQLPSDTSFQTLQMAYENGDYFIDLPLLQVFGTIRYYFELVDPNFRWRLPVSGAERPFSFNVGADTVAPTVYVERIGNHLALLPVYEISVSIQENSELDSTNIFLYFLRRGARVDSSRLTFIPEESRFLGEISAQLSYGDTVEYWLAVKDRANPPNYAKGDTVQFIIGLDDFESGLEQWVVHSPQWALDSTLARSGNFALSTSPERNYEDNLAIAITTRDFLDFSQVDQAELQFHSLYEIEPGDAGYVDLKVGDGEWQVIAGPFSGLQRTWTLSRLNLLPFAGLTNCLIRFRFQSDANTVAPLKGWSVDNVRIVQDDYITGIALAGENGQIPSRFQLWPSFPNPMRSHTNIILDMASASFVTVSIYNLLGQKVRELHNGSLDKGRIKWTWDSTDDFGDSLPGGIYFISVKSKSFKLVQKLIVLH